MKWWNRNILLWNGLHHNWNGITPLWNRSQHYGMGLLIAIYVVTLLALTPEHRMDNLTVTIQIC